MPADAPPLLQTITVRVTDADIRDGEQGECKRCPIALAITRRLSDRADVKVSNRLVRFWDLRDLAFEQVEVLPEPARRFIYIFDLDGSAEPFAFPLQVPRRLMKEADRAT